MNNLQRITAACFLAYFVMSGMLTPLGIISGPMADYFGRPITEITANFSWLTMGIFVGAVLALFIYEYLALKQALLGVYALLFICLVSLPLQSGLTGIWPALGLVGVCCGLGLAGAAITIAKSYELERRASMLIITDGCFSVAGFVCSWLAVQLLVRDAQWYGTYLFVACIACIILGLSAYSTFPDNRFAETKEQKTAEPWPVGAWICIFTLTIYTTAQSSLLLWLPNYAETQLGAGRDQAGQLVSQFWMGMFIAQLFVAWWVLKIGVRRVIVIGALASAVTTIPLWLYSDIKGLVLFAMIFGLVNLGFLKVTLSLATQMLLVPPSRLVSALLLGATTGTAIAPWVSSRIVEASNNHVVLIVCSMAYFLVAAMVLLAICISPTKFIAQPSQ